MSQFNGNGCQYVPLGQYNSAAGGCMSNANCQSPGSGKYIVPSYGLMGYNALTVAYGSPPNARANPSCSGYRNIETAYGKNAGGGSCASFTTAPCN